MPTQPFVKAPAAMLLAAVWLLLASDSPNAPGARWVTQGTYPSEDYCQQARAGEVAQDTMAAIGSALAALPPDNPMRQQAYRRAEARATVRYRCEEK